MSPFIKTMYVGTISPLVIGSLAFFYWFYKRTWFAEDIDIEGFILFIIFLFLIFALIAFVALVTILFDNPANWKKISIPIVAVAITFLLINFYSSIYNSLSEKNFIRIINDTDLKISRVWSKDFEINSAGSKGKDFVISFDYESNPVYVDIIQPNTVKKTYNLSDYYKRRCSVIKVTDIQKKATE